MNIIAIAAIGLHCLLCSGVFAAGGGGQAGDFLRQDAAARGAAMGGALAGAVDDSSALMYNPAGLSRLVKRETLLSRVILFQDTTFDYASGALATKSWGNFGAAYVRQTSGGFERRATPNDAPTTFSISPSAFIGGWAISTPLPGFAGGGLIAEPKPLSVGLAVKAVHESIDTLGASSNGADFGLLLRPNPRLSIGAAVRNLMAPSVSFGAQSFKYPRIIDVSPAYLWTRSENLRVLIAARVMQVQGESLSYSGGVEVQYHRMAALRVGYQPTGYSAGLGFRWGNTQIDYAGVMQALGLSHMATLTRRFGYTREELEDTIRRGITELSRGQASKLSKAYLQKAEADISESRISDALRDLEAAALLDPSNAAVREKIAEVKSRLDDSIKRQTIERASVLAHAQYEQGNLLASREYWRSILEIDPNDSQARLFLRRIDGALSQEQRRRVAEAGDQVQRRSLSLASELLAREKYQEARSEAEKAFPLEPENARLRQFLARLERAQRASIDARLGKAQRMIGSGNFSDALELLETVLRDEPANAGAAKLAQQARADLRKVLTPEDRKQIEQLYYRAVEQYLKGNYEAAEPLVRQVLQLDPANEAGRALKEKVDAASRITREKI